MTASTAQVTLSVEELEAIREEARSEAKLALVPAVAPASVGFSVEDLAAIRDEYDDRLRTLELELKRAREDIAKARAGEAAAKRGVEEILRAAYNLEQLLSKRIG